MPDLRTTHDTLLSMANYLLETAMRAQVAGVATPAFPMSSVIGMAQALMRAVVDLEATGAGGPSSGPAPTSPPGSPSSGGVATDMSAYLKTIMDQVQARVDQMQQAAMSEIQRQIAAQQNAGVPPAPAPPPPAPAGP